MQSLITVKMASFEAIIKVSFGYAPIVAMMVPAWYKYWVMVSRNLLNPQHMLNLLDDERSKEQPKHTNDQYPNQETEDKDKQGRTEQDEKLNDSLKDQGMDKEKSASIAQTQDAGEGAEDADVYENMSMEDLYSKAKEAGIDGYYDMRKERD